MSQRFLQCSLQTPSKINAGIVTHRLLFGFI